MGEVPAVLVHPLVAVCHGFCYTHIRSQCSARRKDVIDFEQLNPWQEHLGACAMLAWALASVILGRQAPFLKSIRNKAANAPRGPAT